jgi:hypothetical protein
MLLVAKRGHTNSRSDDSRAFKDLCDATPRAREKAPRFGQHEPTAGERTGKSQNELEKYTWPNFARLARPAG